jgi:hypothetical protein
MIKSRRITRVGHGTDEKCIQVLVGKSERNRPLDRCRHRWVDIKMDLKGTSEYCPHSPDLVQADFYLSGYRSMKYMIEN